MKNLRILSMLLIATIAGLAAVVFASRWLTQQSSSGITKVVVAAADIDLGQRLSPDFIKTVDWPTASLPPGSISDTHALDGRVVRTSLTRGEPVLESKLTPQGTAGGLSAVIADGKRAITVRVNDVVGVAGFALPGSYVDIIVNTIQDSKDTKAAAGDRADQSISKIVLEKILVLAVAQEVNRDDTKPKVVNAVTLEVTPDQAEKLDLARSVGTLAGAAQPGGPAPGRHQRCDQAHAAQGTCHHGGRGSARGQDRASGAPRRAACCRRLHRRDRGHAAQPGMLLGRTNTRKNRQQAPRRESDTATDLVMQNNQSGGSTWTDSSSIAASRHAAWDRT